jgi:hypothetical protein
MTPIQERKLVEFVEGKLGSPFVWGGNDCNTFSIEWVDLLTGSNHLQEIKGKYSTKREAVDYYAEHTEFTETVLAGWKEIPASTLSMGDIFIITNGDFVEGHVCVGRTVASIHRKQGGVLLPKAKVDSATAWRWKG